MNGCTLMPAAELIRMIEPPAYHEFNRRIMEHGLQHALAWRDGPFKQS
jgi:hypothetical protein